MEVKILNFGVTRHRGINSGRGRGRGGGGRSGGGRVGGGRSGGGRVGGGRGGGGRGGGGRGGGGRAGGGRGGGGRGGGVRGGGGRAGGGRGRGARGGIGRGTGRDGGRGGLGHSSRHSIRPSYRDVLVEDNTPPGAPGASGADASSSTPRPDGRPTPFSVFHNMLKQHGEMFLDLKGKLKGKERKLEETLQKILDEESLSNAERCQLLTEYSLMMSDVEAAGGATKSDPSETRMETDP
ncbi:rRNA 2'-O-methyltransferase fibrillarin-like, partial [Phlebotomus papatasi]|uniref:rRNA 2'-O-methyltransferase fibrillarin-like n=1 Tax=Phlebotomus papatasi TaxID=29031 RepID=UPI0024833F12